MVCTQGKTRLWRDGNPFSVLLSRQATSRDDASQHPSHNKARTQTQKRMIERLGCAPELVSCARDSEGTQNLQRDMHMLYSYYICNIASSPYPRRGMTARGHQIPNAIRDGWARQLGDHKPTPRDSSAHNQAHHKYAHSQIFLRTRLLPHYPSFAYA